MTTPREYEHLVARHFRELGYTTEVTAYSNDYGLDVLAENSAERLAIQAKLYGHTGRKVNRQMLMELYGVSAYFGCDRAVLATDGALLEDAVEVARKLGIQILRLPADNVKPEQLPRLPKKATTPEMSAERIWMDYVVPLEGATLTDSRGRTNKVLSVNWSGIERITSSGNRGRIDYEIFRLAIDHLLRCGMITRDEINQNYAKRASSGVVLILAQVPIFRLERQPTLRLLFDRDD